MTKEESEERERLYDDLNIAERDLNKELKDNSFLRAKLKSAESLALTWVFIASVTALIMCASLIDLI